MATGLGYSFPVKVPEDEYDCRYRGFGRVGRAARDVRYVAMNRFGGVLTFALCPILTAAAFFVIPGDADVRARVALAVGGFVMGGWMAAGLIFSYSVSPLGRRDHWRIKIGDDTHDDRFLSLTSRHWHWTRNVQCIVTDPNGRRWRVAQAHRFGTETLYKPGDGPGPVLYPRDFVNGRGCRAPKSLPGRHRVRWEMDTEHGPERRVTLATGRWKEPKP